MEAFGLAEADLGAAKKPLPGAQKITMANQP
jgi:hypothetical protein